MDKKILKLKYEEIMKAAKVPDSTDALFDFEQKSIPDTIKSIYIIQFGRVGETIWGIKAIEKLSSIYCNRKIVFVVERNREDLFLKRYPFKVEFWDFECFVKMIRELSDNTLNILVNLGRNNISRICAYYLQEITNCMVIGSTQIKNIIHIYGNDYTIASHLKSCQQINYLHESEILLKKMGVNETFDFKQNESKHYCGGVIAIAAGASNPIRKWGNDKFVDLINRINEQIPATYVILGTNDEVQEFRKQSSKLKMVNCEYTNRKSLLEQINILKACDLLICNDSGWMHIAETLDIMTICISGPTNPYVTGCYFSEGISVCADIKCRPCYGIACDSIKCQTFLSVESIYKIVIAWMKSVKPVIGKNIKVVYRKNGHWKEMCSNNKDVQTTVDTILRKVTIHAMCEYTKDYSIDRVNSKLVKDKLCQIANNFRLEKEYLQDFIKYDLSFCKNTEEKSVLFQQLYEWIKGRPFYLFALFELLLVKNGFWNSKTNFSLDFLLKELLERIDFIYDTLWRISDDR